MKIILRPTIPIHSASDRQCLGPYLYGQNTGCRYLSSIPSLSHNLETTNPANTLLPLFDPKRLFCLPNSCFHANDPAILSAICDVRPSTYSQPTPDLGTYTKPQSQIELPSINYPFEIPLSEMDNHLVSYTGRL
jgi:hypothetical protein